jgi:cytochrome c553
MNMHKNARLTPLGRERIARQVAHAEDNPAHVSAQELKAKTEYCETCHGIEGQGFRGWSPMPRLAGQQPGYIESQLKAFIDRNRTNPMMSDVAHALDPAMVAALSAEFKNLNPKPLGGAPTALVPEGKKIYEDGSERQRSPL